MRRMDSFDSPQGPQFKKRTHRPWKPTLLENGPEDHLMPPLEALEHARSNSLDSLNMDLTEFELQRSIEEKTKEFSEIHDHLSAKEENRVMIGGFLQAKNIFSSQEEEIQNTHSLMDELKTKEQEILLLSQNLEAVKALDQIEKLEQSKKKEEEARKAAEEKALFAIQQAKLATEQTRKAEQSAQNERKARIELERTKKVMEERVQRAMQEVERGAQTVSNEEKARKEVEEKMKEVLHFAREAELKLQKETEAKLQHTLAQSKELEEKVKQESEKRIQEALKLAYDIEQTAQREKEAQISAAQKEAFEKITAMEEEAAEKIRNALAQAQNQIRFEQQQAEKKVRTSEKEIEFHEKAKLAAQVWAQKSIESARKTENLRKELEDKLELVLRKSEDERKTLQQDIENLLVQVRELKDQKVALENDKTQLESRVFEIHNNLKKLEIVLESERSLRRVLEAKLTDSQTRRDEVRRKLSEDKILELTKKIADMEIANSYENNRVSSANENVRKLEITIESEKSIRRTMENQMKEFLDKIYKVEQQKQAEADARLLAEQKITALMTKLQHHENEKAQNLERVSKCQDRIQELEALFETEQYLRKEAERLRILEERAKKAAQEKISYAMDQANKTVLNVLGNFIPVPPTENDI